MINILKFIAIVVISFTTIIIGYAIIEEKYWEKKEREDGENFHIIGNIEKYKKK